ncbi:hypothetical protein Ddc_19504 [Ditylenchus destructor]|nr:hypothetical protein Ddc_19504 [Ditylenchus destructor]
MSEKSRSQFWWLDAVGKIMGLQLREFSIVEEENNIRRPLLNMLTNEKLEFVRCKVSLFAGQLEADVVRRSRIAQ